MPFDCLLIRFTSPLLLKMSVPPLKILLVEDDELFRLGLRVRLQQELDLEVTAEAEDGETAVELSKSQPFDIAVLDIGLPGLGGVEACRQIRQLCPNLPVLVLTSHAQKALINRIIAAGAQGYCLKGMPADTLILAIRSVAAGASWWDPAATTEIRAAFGNPAPTIATPEIPDRGTAALTRREQEILALIAAGKSNQEIAAMLYITQGTVRVHVHAILQKLEVRDRTQAAVIAIQRQLIAKELLPE